MTTKRDLILRGSYFCEKCTLLEKYTLLETEMKVVVLEKGEKGQRIHQRYRYKCENGYQNCDKGGVFFCKKSYLCKKKVTIVAKYWVFIYEPHYDHNDLFFWISSLRTQSKNYINIWN